MSINIPRKWKFCINNFKAFPYNTLKHSRIGCITNRLLFAMKFISCILLFMILVVLVIAKPHTKRLPENLKLVGQALNKQYYKSQNSAYYEAAKTDCEQVQHGRLVNIENAVELEEIYRITLDSGDAIAKMWVGAKVTRTPECAQSLVFYKDCWIWDGVNEAVDTEVIEWSAETESKPQSRTDRAFLDTILGSLDFEPNTSANRYLCETLIPPACY